MRIPRSSEWMVQTDRLQIGNTQPSFDAVTVISSTTHHDRPRTRRRQTKTTTMCVSERTTGGRSCLDMELPLRRKAISPFV